MRIVQEVGIVAGVEYILNIDLYGDVGCKCAGFSRMHRIKRALASSNMEADAMASAVPFRIWFSLVQLPAAGTCLCIYQHL